MRLTDFLFPPLSFSLSRLLACSLARILGGAGVDIHTEEVAGPQLRVDFFDTRQQVRQFVEREQAAARAAKEEAKRNRTQKQTATSVSAGRDELASLDVSAESA
jgi:hypothetical protein